MSTGRVESLLPGGEALIRSERGLFLATNGVPGDRVEFEAAGRQRGSNRGRLTNILEPSPDRRQAACPVAAECGGCALQYLHSDRHASVKTEWVSNAFRRSLLQETERLPIFSGRADARRRLRWFVGSHEQGAFLGFRAASSHRVIRHEHCMVVTGALNRLRARLESSFELGRFKSVQAMQLHDGIHLVLEDGSVAGDFAPPWTEIEGLPVQWWLRQDDVTRALARPVHVFHDRLPAGDSRQIDVRIGPDDFIQGQQAGNEAMIRQLIDWSTGSRFVVDLFSGIGNLSLPLAAANGCRVAGAELNVASVRAANANATALSLDARYHHVNLFESFDGEPFAGADLLILDPPRRGAKKVCAMMGRLLPARVVMVNCDTAAGGRDGETLQSIGYRLKSLRAFDLFPYTGHVEAMSLWIR